MWTSIKCTHNAVVEKAWGSSRKEKKKKKKRKYLKYYLMLQCRAGFSVRAAGRTTKYLNGCFLSFLTVRES